jgi:acyl-CoA dehydrogenase
VPKFLVEADGSLGRLNDVRCVSIEHKLGIHASPTAVLAFGDNEGAIGWLVGEESRGLETMFIMMNGARFSVGLQGIGMAERACQRALAYARERVQGVETGGRGTVPIIRDTDVRRMLMLMKSRTEALRAVACVVAAAMDRARCHVDAAERSRSQAFVDLMIPVVENWSTESAIDIASLGVQIHGGMGFIEETCAAQHLRDVRIAAIYEGTTGIQAADLIGRKIVRDGAVAIGELIEQMRAVLGQLSRAGDERICRMEGPLRAGVDAVEQAVRFIVGSYGSDPKKPLVGAVPFLELLGIVAGGWQMARAALIAHRGLRDHAGDPFFYRTKLATARFYVDHVLARTPGLANTAGATGAFAMEDDQF